MITLGGNVCVRNGDELDYCWRDAVRSLLPICESVTVCDGTSDDGTQEEIRQWQLSEPKLRLCVYPWHRPVGDIDFWVNWLNYCREHIREDFMIQLDADEVLHENSYDFLNGFKARTSPGDRVSLWCSRYNFWRDAQSLIPQGECCSYRVVRVSPQSVWLPSDGPHVKGADAISMGVPTSIQIFHYGFLRKTKAWFAKAHALQNYFFGSYDPRLKEIEERNPENWMTEIKDVEWIHRLLPFKGTHPAAMESWLKERGYHV